MNNIVLDTNVFLMSLPKTSEYRLIFDALLQGKFNLLITEEIFHEYKEIIGRKTTTEIARNISELLSQLNNVKVISAYYKWGLITEDYDDNKFVDCAIAGNASFIVTNDKHFSVLKNINFPNVDILSAKDFLKELE